jgi:hypothetical protein
MSSRSVASLILACCALLPACASASPASAVPVPSAASAAPVHGLTRAFNAHDVEAMSRHVTKDVQWLSLQGAMLSIDAEGREALASAMADYFRSLPSVRTEIEVLEAGESFVVVRERVHWVRNDAPTSQSALAVYELRDGLIARVWYFAAER